MSRQGRTTGVKGSPSSRKSHSEVHIDRPPLRHQYQTTSTSTVSDNKGGHRNNNREDKNPKGPLRKLSRTQNVKEIDIRVVMSVGRLHPLSIRHQDTNLESGNHSESL